MRARSVCVVLACLVVSARAQESVVTDNSDVSDIDLEGIGVLAIPPCMSSCAQSDLDLLLAATTHHERCHALGVTYDSYCMDNCKGSGPAYHAIDQALEDCCASRPGWRGDGEVLG
jgi:hypothetical protein